MTSQVDSSGSKSPFAGASGGVSGNIGGVNTPAWKPPSSKAPQSRERYSTPAQLPKIDAPFTPAQYSTPSPFRGAQGSGGSSGGGGTGFARQNVGGGPLTPPAWQNIVTNPQNINIPNPSDPWLQTLINGSGSANPTSPFNVWNQTYPQGSMAPLTGNNQQWIISLVPPAQPVTIAPPAWQSPFSGDWAYPSQTQTATQNPFSGDWAYGDQTSYTQPQAAAGGGGGGYGGYGGGGYGGGGRGGGGGYSKSAWAPDAGLFQWNYKG